MWDLHKLEDLILMGLKSGGHEIVQIRIGTLVLQVIINYLSSLFDNIPSNFHDTSKMPFGDQSLEFEEIFEGKSSILFIFNFFKSLFCDLSLNSLNNVGWG